MKKPLFLRIEQKWKTKYLNKGFKKILSKHVSKKHLDFGCGYGALPFLLAKDFPKLKVVGIDIDKDQIKIGKQRYKRKNLQLKCTDKITGKFDSISSFFSIHHLKAKDLKEFHKHLNPGGKLIIFDFRKVPKSKFKEWYEKKKIIGEYKDSFEKSYKEHSRWSVEEFSNLMQDIGFKTLKAEKAAKYWLWYVGKKHL